MDVPSHDALERRTGRTGATCCWLGTGTSSVPVGAWVLPPFVPVADGAVVPCTGSAAAAARVTGSVTGTLALDDCVLELSAAAIPIQVPARLIADPATTESVTSSFRRERGPSCALVIVVLVLVPTPTTIIIVMPLGAHEHAPFALHR